MNEVRAQRTRLAPGLLRSVSEMALWRGVAMAIGMAGSIWSARCLGPENLGISSMVLATLGQIGLLNTLLPDQALVRRYKLAAGEDERRSIVELVFTVRALFGAVLWIVSGVVVVLAGVPEPWALAVWAAWPMLLLHSNGAGFILQAQERQAAQYRIAALTTVFTTAAILLFFRPGQRAGSDVVVQAVVGLVGLVLSWRLAGVARPWRLFSPARLAGVGLALREGQWIFWSGVVVYLYTAFETPLLGYLRPLDEVGVYRTAAGLSAVIQSFLVFSSLLLYPRFITWYQQSPELLWRRQKILALAYSAGAIPIIVAAFLTGPWLYRTLYGESFAAAALPFGLLVASRFVVLVNGVFGWGLWAQGQDRTMFAVMLGAGIVSLGLNLLLVPRFGMVAAAAVNVTSETIILAGTILFSRQRIMVERLANKALC